jgi:hypothetical protein
MRNKPEILEKYDSIIQDQLKKGVIEKVNDSLSDGLVHYIPHHAVITPQKTLQKSESFTMLLLKLQMKTKV